MKSDLDIFFEENWIALQDAAQKISNQDDQWEDLLHLCLEDFLAKENVNEIILSGGGRFYLIRMMLNQYRSSTSWFHKTYRQPVEENNPNFEEEYEDPYEQEEPKPLTMIGRRLDAIQKMKAGELTWKDYINSLTPEELAHEKEQSRARYKKWYQENKEHKKEYNKVWSHKKKGEKASTSSSSYFSSRLGDECDETYVVSLNCD